MTVRIDLRITQGLAHQSGIHVSFFFFDTRSTLLIRKQCSGYIAGDASELEGRQERELVLLQQGSKFNNIRSQDTGGTKAM